jgi:hypothetical protein
MDDAWGLVALGLLLGIPLGMAALWFLVQAGQHQSGLPVTYSNVEEWEFVRDPATGRTLGVKVHREARGA